MANSNRVSWETDLRKSIRSNYGQGWTVIGENSGRTKLTYQYPNEARKASNTLSLEWKKTNGLQILKAIEFINPLVRIENLTLKEAARRWKAQFVGDDIKTPNKAWKDFLIIPPKFSYDKKEYQKAYKEYEAELKATSVDQFMAKLQGLTSKTEKDWFSRIRPFLELISKRNAPKTGEELVKELARDFGEITPDQKKRYLNAWCEILTYGIERHSMPKRWTPPNENIIKELRGISNRTKQEALTPYIKENDLFALLDDLESSDPEMFLATGLISIFGLRIAELAVLKVREGNLYVGHVKNNRNTTNKKRTDRRVFAMDLIEKPNLGKKLISLYKSELIKLPKTILNQIKLVEKKRSFGDVGQAFTDKLSKNKTWIEITSRKKNKDITAYSLRHRFAHQCHKGSGNPISIKDAAAAMGHSVNTHMNSYGSYTDELAVEKAFERHAENRIEA